ncbi:MAG: hypothetical protein U5K81_06770 [Trueperaceae bacterium]|nr:hypothetical protein [Trueperaceae bacterium]
MEGQTLSERQIRIIGEVSAIRDPALLNRIERLIDAYRSGLRVLNDREMDDILADLRPGDPPSEER